MKPVHKQTLIKHILKTFIFQLFRDSLLLNKSLEAVNGIETIAHPWY